MTGRKKGGISCFGGGGGRKKHRKLRNSPGGSARGSPRRSPNPNPECKKCKANSAPSTPQARSRSSSPRGRRRASSGSRCFGGAKRKGPRARSRTSRSRSPSPVSPRALPIEHCPDTMPRVVKVEHRCGSPRSGCSDHRCHKEEPRSRVLTPPKAYNVKASLRGYKHRIGKFNKPSTYNVQFNSFSSPSPPILCSWQKCQSCQTMSQQKPCGDGGEQDSNTRYLHIDLRYMTRQMKANTLRRGNPRVTKARGVNEAWERKKVSFQAVEHPLEPIEMDKPAKCPRMEPFITQRLRPCP